MLQNVLLSIDLDEGQNGHEFTNLFVFWKLDYVNMMMMKTS